jgi:hypothetical protein
MVKALQPGRWAAAGLLKPGRCGGPDYSLHRWLPLHTFTDETASYPVTQEWGQAVMWLSFPEFPWVLSVWPQFGACTPFFRPALHQP